jgi:hypothetical protein
MIIATSTTVLCISLFSPTYRVQIQNTTVKEPEYTHTLDASRT